MRKVYEAPEAEIVVFAAMEQLALLTPRDGESTDVAETPGISGSVGGRGDDY